MSQVSNRTSGRLYIFLAVTIFGAANAITRRLTDLGASNLIDGRNPISFCNVLFVGNLCALLLLCLLYRRQLIPTSWQNIQLKSWGAIALVSLMTGVAVPTLVFSALALTTVNNVVLLGQIDTPLMLALSVWLLKERTNKWVVAGATVSLVGVILTTWLQPPGENSVSMGMGLSLGIGELFVIVAAVIEAIANTISKVSLQQIPLGIFSVVRMLLGTIVFFVVANLLYGAGHFMDVASPFLWRWMVIYSAVIVVGGQLLWFSGLKRTTASEISLATAFNPIAGVLSAYLILGEVPNKAHYIGGVVILLGIALNQYGLLRLNNQKPTAMPDDIAYKGI